MNALGQFIQHRFGLNVEAVGRYGVILEEHKTLTLSQLTTIKRETQALDVEVSAYDDAQVPGDQHPQLMVRIIK